MLHQSRSRVEERKSDWTLRSAKPISDGIMEQVYVCCQREVLPPQRPRQVFVGPLWCQWGRRPMPFDDPKTAAEMRVSFACGSRYLAPCGDTRRSVPPDMD